MDANWISAIGTVVGTAIAAIAAAFSAWAACTARKIGKDAVAATKQQTETSAVHNLLNHYAGPEMYRALHQFGQFVHEDADHSARFKRITERFAANGSPEEAEGNKDEDLKWAVDAMESRPELGEARRRIHHHFKRVWALQHAGILSDRNLRLLTVEQSGWSLWRDTVLPVTGALGDRLRGEGRHTVDAQQWAKDLLAEVKKTEAAPRTS